MEYTLYIKNQTGGGDSSGNSFPDTKPPAEEETKTTGVEKFQKGFKVFAKVYAATAIPRQIFRYELSRVGVRTGNSNWQDKVDFGMQVADQAASVIMASIGGFVVGGAVGGAVGIMTSMASVGISYAQKLDQYDFNKEWESISLWQTRLRAGPSLNRSREH